MHVFFSLKVWNEDFVLKKRHYRKLLENMIENVKNVGKTSVIMKKCSIMIEIYLNFIKIGWLFKRFLNFNENFDLLDLFFLTGSFRKIILQFSMKKASFKLLIYVHSINKSLIFV